jgi:hypothetical protein
LSGTEALGPSTEVEWWHRTVLQSETSIAYARAFVSHHLVRHRMFHLVDIASVVAGGFASECFGRAHAPLTLSLSEAASQVTLKVGGGPGAAASFENPLDALEGTYGPRAIGLLSTAWGVSRAGEEAVGLWADFDARRHPRTP